MADSFVYSKSNDFSTELSLPVLAKEIYDGITTELQSIDRFGDSVTVYFVDDLTTQEETDLDNIVDTHGGYSEEPKIIAGLDDTMLNVLVDEDGDYTYVGECIPGTLTSESAWRIFRLDESGATEELVKIFANNDSAFDKIWDNRVSYSYSVL